MSRVKWRQLENTNVDSFGSEDHSEVEVDDSRPLDMCTVDEAVEKIGFGAFQVIAMSFAGLIWTVEAFEFLLLAILSAVLKCEWGLSSVEEASLTSVIFVGSFIGTFFWGFYIDMYGRKWGLFFVALLSSCFGIMSAFSPNFGMMVFIRALLGFGGAGGGQGVTFCAEYLPAKSRGIGIMLTEIFWVVGAIGIVAIGWATVPTLGWRWLLGFAAIPVTVMTFFIPLMPSSPRYLIIKGKREQALRNINIVARINCKSKLHIKLVTDEEKEEMMSERLTDRPSINDENDKVMDSLQNPVSNSSKSYLLVHKRTPKSKDSIPSIVDQIPQTLINSLYTLQCSQTLDVVSLEIQQSRVMDLFRNGMWKTTFLLWAIWLNFVAYYYGIILLTTTLFQYDKHCSLSGDCHTDSSLCKTLEDDDYSALLWTSAAEVPGVFFTMLLLVVPCLGRKLVLGIEMALLTIFTGLLLICADRTFLTIVLFVCRGLIAGSFQGIYVYTPEVYPTTVRGMGLGIASSCGRVGGMVIPFIAQSLIQVNDVVTIAVFVAMAAINLILVALLPIETKGRSLRDTNH